MNNSNPAKILVSACLYGQATAYDGKNRTLHNETLLRWKSEDKLIPVCAEVLGGLSIPRCPSEIYKDKVITKDGNDVTYEFRKGADEVLKIAKENNIKIAILKDGSPSCGCHKIYDGSFEGRKIDGVGICAKLLIQNGIKVFSGDEINLAEEYLDNL